MFVKRFIYQKWKGLEVDQNILKRYDIEIQSIEAYIKSYHYSNFDSAYRNFDRQDMLLLDPEFRESG